jgi:enduracididine biosynthesis enzyme MppP
MGERLRTSNRRPPKESDLPRLNLTQMEVPALTGEVNVADGHARQELTSGQRRIVESFPALFEATQRASFDELERETVRELFGALGQESLLRGPARVLSAYSSSVAVSVLARALTTRTSAVALVHPTFDNIPDILRGAGLRLVPVPEEELLDGSASALSDGVGCLLVTTPNNPTGAVLGPDALASLAEACLARRALLVLDTSFRGFDERAMYDSYAVLEEAGVEYVVVEDTGKLWPMQELKLGFLVAADHCALPLEQAMTDILLSVSPFVLGIVAQLAADARAGGFVQLRRLIAENREVVRQGLSDTDAFLPDRDARVSVCRVALPEGWSAEAVRGALLGHGVHVLPCGPFHWADPPEGDGFVRLALARDREVVEAATSALAARLTSGILAG